MKTINEIELVEISGGQMTSGQYDLGYIIGYLLTGLINYSGYVTMNYPLAFK